MKKFLTIIIFTQTLAAANFTEKVEYVPTLYPNGYCNILKRTITYKDGVEISVQNHRYNLEPESDLSQFDARVKSVCKANWTPDVVKKFKENKAKVQAELDKGIPK